MIEVLVFILAAAFLIAASIATTGGLVWLVCWAFGFAWSWKLSIGVWGVMTLLSLFLKRSKDGE